MMRIEEASYDQGYRIYKGIGSRTGVFYIPCTLHVSNVNKRVKQFMHHACLNVVCMTMYVLEIVL